MVDAADRDARSRAIRTEEEAKALARRSQAIKRGLPRPIDVNGPAIIRALGSNNAAESAVLREMVAMLEHDAVAYPVPGGSRASGTPQPLAAVSDEEMEAARAAIAEEAAGNVPTSDAEALAADLRPQERLQQGAVGRDVHEEDVPAEGL